MCTWWEMCFNFRALIFLLFVQYIFWCIEYVSVILFVPCNSTHVSFAIWMHLFLHLLRYIYFLFLYMSWCLMILLKKKDMWYWCSIYNALIIYDLYAMNITRLISGIIWSLWRYDNAFTGIQIYFYYQFISRLLILMFIYLYLLCTCIMFITFHPLFICYTLSFSLYFFGL